MTDQREPKGETEEDVKILKKKESSRGAKAPQEVATKNNF